MRNFGICVLMIAAACGSHRPDGGTTDGNGGGGDSHGSNGGGDGGDGTTTYVYAHTDTTLYRVDPDTLAITMVGPFGWPGGAADQMTDIAIDKNGVMIGVSFTAVYKVDPTNAHTTLLSSSLSGTFNGLSYVPASAIGGTGDDVLVGTRGDDGKVFRIDPMTGSATMIGDMGAYSSSGDLVAVEGFGIAQTVIGTSNDRLAKLAPQTFAATPVGTDTGYGSIFGVAFWKNKIYGFTEGGQFILIDPTTGAATLVQGNGPAWWGAAVTTLAPVIQ